MKKQTAANNEFLAAVKKLMNKPIYQETLNTVNAEGEDVARVYLQQYFRTPVSEVFPR